MTAALSRPTVSPLAPITTALATMRARHGADSLHGLAPALITHPDGWLPAGDLIDGDRMADLLDTAKQRWSAQPHAAAALAWKCYTYWLALPAVLGYAVCRRVPLVTPEHVLIRYSVHQPFLTLGLRAGTPVAVLPGDPIAAAPGADVRVVPDEAALRAVLRDAVLDRHLDPLLDRIRASVHIGRRTLLGSLASGVSHALSRATDTFPGSTLELTEQLLTTLGVADLVELTAQPGGELQVQRRTCCLAFTLPQPRICTGCCIRA